MLFNSVEFFVFLPLVFALYWLLRNQLKAQNLLVLIASYCFYGFWDWRFLSLIILSSFVDFFIGKAVHQAEGMSKKKRLLWVSLLVNLGILFMFKYFDFFVGSFVEMANRVGVSANWTSLNWILPIGISFYTFQTLSYTIDIYKERMKPTDSILDFFVYVAFFPQLVAGPIERAVNLLPQFGVKRTFNYTQAVDGSRQLLWGLFKKVVIADNCAVYVDAIYNNQADLYGPILLLGGILFIMQIYCDFSGYSDAAIGSARLLGFELKQNFANPYFSTNSTEFWRRWHISMSTWFRDYVYQPLGAGMAGLEEGRYVLGYFCDFHHNRHLARCQLDLCGLWCFSGRCSYDGDMDSEKEKKIQEKEEVLKAVLWRKLVIDHVLLGISMYNIQV